MNGEVELLPPDVETKVSALQRLDVDSQARSVTVLLSHARTGLLAAIAAQDLPGIVEYKQKAHAITEISKQLRLGKELQLDAAEFLRRAERGLGVAIRQGQANGTIETPAEGKARAGRNRHSADCARQSADKPRPLDFASATELSGSGATPGAYALADNVSDSQFDDAIDEAKAEGNLSRKNVARKVRAKAKPTISDDDPLIDADVEPPPPKAKRHGGPKGDPNEMLGNVDGMLRGIVTTLEFIRPEDIDGAKRKALTEGIFQSINLIRKHVKEISNG